MLEKMSNKIESAKRDKKRLTPKNIRPAVSVVMSAYNAEKFIRESVDSILNQTFSNFEFIIFEDKSTDNTREILKRYQKLDKRIRLLCRNQNQGITLNLNQGIRMARGKYIARMDADDISDSARLQKQFDYLEQHSDCQLVATSAKIIDENSNFLRNLTMPSVRRLKNKLLYWNVLVHCSIMFRSADGYKYRTKMLYAEDYDLYLRMMSDDKKIVALRDNLVSYRIFPVSTAKRAALLVIDLRFAGAARDFYYQREEYGKDKYAYFDPDKIIHSPPKYDTEQLLEYKIKALIKEGKYTAANKYCRKCAERYGFRWDVFILQHITKSKMIADISKGIFRILKRSNW